MNAQEMPVSLVLPPPKVERASGVHLSSVLRSVGVEAGILPSSFGVPSLVDRREITDQQAILRMCIGLAWEEHYIANQLPNVIDHPGEISCDGIHMTPDGEEIGVVLVGARYKALEIVHEVKATSKCADINLDEQWLWMAQIKGYCKGKGTRHAMLHALFLAGYHVKPYGPVLRRWLLEFTQQEIDENWELVTSYVDNRPHLVEGAA